MHPKNYFMPVVAAYALWGAALTAHAAAPATSFPDLSRAIEGKDWKISNATAEPQTVDGRSAVRLKAAGDSASRIAGLAVVRQVEFATGTIEIDLKGKDVKQRSFLGVAFNIRDDKTFEAIYFRPFNFTGEPPANQRAVQYLAWPENTWEKLRKETPGQFEGAVKPIPNPNGWFHARIVVEEKQVQVFVDGAKEPSLTVKRLAPGGAKKPVGLFVDVDEGLYANLKISPE